jgi:hypothetical protein
VAATPLALPDCVELTAAKIVFETACVDVDLRAKAWPTVGSEPAAGSPDCDAENSAQSWV